MTAAAFALVMLVAAQAAANLPALLLPPENGAWVVRVETSGGFTGRGTGHFTASSAGNFACVSVKSCPDRLVPERQRTLTALVSALPAVEKIPPSGPLQPGSCSDCVTTTMIVRQRTPEGERTLRYSWDLSTMTTIPEEARRLHAAIDALLTR
jgi:hypothetical protein